MAIRDQARTTVWSLLIFAAALVTAPGAVVTLDDFSEGEVMVQSTGLGMHSQLSGVGGGLFGNRRVSLEIRSNPSQDEALVEVDSGFGLFFLEVPNGVAATGGLEYRTGAIHGLNLLAHGSGALAILVDFANGPFDLGVEVTDVLGVSAQGDISAGPVPLGALERIAIPLTSLENADFTDFTQVEKLTLTLSPSTDSGDFSLAALQLIPESSSALLAGLASALILVRRRR